MVKASDCLSWIIELTEEEAVAFIREQYAKVEQDKNPSR